MKLYLLTQDWQGYDTYDAIVVAARTELEALELTKDKIYDSSMEIRIIAESTNEPLGEVIGSFNAG